MSRKSDPVKIRQWSTRLKRFAKSDETVAEFCRDEGVSVPSFYQWKKKLGGKTKLANRRGLQTKSARRAKSPAFKPVHVAPPDKLSGVTIRLPDGIVVELGNDMLTIEKVMNQLLGHQSSGGAESC